MWTKQLYERLANVALYLCIDSLVLMTDTTLFLQSQFAPIRKPFVAYTLEDNVLSIGTTQQRLPKSEIANLFTPWATRVSGFQVHIMCIAALMFVIFTSEAFTTDEQNVFSSECLVADTVAYFIMS